MWPFKRKTEDRALFNIGDLVTPTSHAGVSVTTDSAQRLSAVWACIRLLCDTISTMPVHSFAIGSQVPIDPPPMILRTPAAGTPFHEWVAMIMRSLLTHGDAWGLISSRAGSALRPSQLIDPIRVGVDVIDGRVIYRLDGQEIRQR
jgi:phage portal protein BeeE